MAASECPPVVWPGGVEITSVDHVQRTFDRLLFQFQGADQPTIQAIVRSYACQSQELEQVFLDLVVQRYLDNAAGAQLDGLGAIVGESRRGRSDTDYRTAIRARIRINKGNARIEDVLLVFTQAFPTSGFNLTEPVPAHVWLEVVAALGPGTPTPQLLAELLDQTVGGGITGRLIYGTVAITSRFSFATADTPEVDALSGFGDDGQTTGGFWSGVEV